MLAALALFALSAVAAPVGDVTATAHVDAVAVSGPNAVRVNGELSDEVWRGAAPIDAFVQREPQDGGEPSERTEFRVAYNATTLFVKVRAYDRQPDRIVTYLTRRDQDSPCDWIRVFVDSYHDRRTAYEFAVNPSGVKFDRYWYNDNNSDDSWDAVWDVTVSRETDGWSAEFRIPFSQLRFNPSPANTFGFAVARQIGRLNETSTWPLLSRKANGYVSSFGELGGLSMSASPKKLEITPYTVANVTTQPTAGNPLLKGAAPGGAFGMDMKYALTPGLTLTTTVNPDFGQVEADPAVVNLSAFETYFNERRPFFVEGSGNFNFNLDCNDGACSGMFYSRRVGRSPQGTDYLPNGDNVYTDVPSQTKILGAAKLTGRVGNYSIGVMQAVSEEAQARVQNGSLFSTQPVEPMTSYTVGRVRREFANQSAIGFMLTNTKRQSADSAIDVLPTSATAGGVDWDLRFRRFYSLFGYWAGSTVRGDAPAIDAVQEDSVHYYQRPDLKSASLDPTRTSLSGDSAQIGISKIGGEYVHFNFNYGFKSPGFEINDVGFLRRADTRNIGNWIQFRSDKPNRWFRSRMINFNEYATWNADGDLVSNGGNVNAHAVFTNNWSIGGGYNVNGLGLDDRVTRGGPAVYQENANGVWYYVNSDNRRPVSLAYFGSYFRDPHGSLGADVNPELTFRPMPSLMVTTGLRFNRNISDTQWVNNVTDTANHYVFAHLDQTTVALTGRFNYTLTPNLSIQLYAQPFVSAGDYSQFRQVASARAADYDARFTPYAYDTIANGDPNFNVKSFRTTNVLRWEYKPGSTVFIVWQQARENDAVPGGFNAGRDLRGIFGAPSTNVFLVKFAYWLNY
ncbi:MAG: carbohydrate binding family 9 domain-containing protein [Acidobacteriia bacterium]|nr:carbohydrate binding family 9 domain-containing protein [Terriglobia bacterium]